MSRPYNDWLSLARRWDRVQWESCKGDFSQSYDKWSPNMVKAFTLARGDKARASEILKEIEG